MKWIPALFFVTQVCSIDVLLAQTAAPDSVRGERADAVNVFLDCNRCDNEYIRTEITYVNYVRDRLQADVHVLVTRQRTGGGGREYTFTFIGDNRFAGVNDTLIFTTSQNDTDDDERRGMVETLRNGLFRYVLHTPQGKNLSARYREQGGPQEIEDLWDYWVFRLNANAFLAGEKSSSFLHYGIGIDVSRTTEDWKIRFESDADYSEDKFEYDDAGVLLKETFIRRSQEFDAVVVRSVTDHWSVGASLFMFSSTYRNLDLSVRAYPAIEYNFFPYSESTRRQLRAQYRVGMTMNQYVDTTIYDKIEETRPIHQLSISLELRQPWGSTSVTLSGSQYLHDLSKNNLRIEGDIDIRIYEGLSFNLHGSYSQIRDQITLPKEGATPAELLTRHREIATNFSYFGSVGLRYSFGSIYNNVVNARMGN
jgi:hypothetical protein